MTVGASVQGNTPERFRCSLIFRWKPKIRRQPYHIALAADDHGLIGVAKPGGGLDHRIQHRLQIEGRAADDLQHVAGRGLVFERLLRSPVRCRNSPSSRAFSIAITAWAAKSVNRAICLSVYRRTSLR